MPQSFWRSFSSAIFILQALIFGCVGISSLATVYCRDRVLILHAEFLIAWTSPLRCLPLPRRALNSSLSHNYDMHTLPSGVFDQLTELTRL